MKCYPVFIPTLNRFTHFKNCVESLSRCTHAEKTELVVGLDYPPSEKYIEGYRQIKDYLPTIKGFAKVTIFQHEKNLGAGGNWLFLENYCKRHYDAYIATEDDNIFSPAFLDYMNKALELFRNDDRIVSVSGYNFLAAYDQGPYKCYLGYDNSAWGVGYWFHKEDVMRKYLADKQIFQKILHSAIAAKKIIKVYPAAYMTLDDMIRKNLDYGDAKRWVLNILNGWYQLKPAVSLVRNCGCDGSGLNCESDGAMLSSQVISDEQLFDFSSGVGSADTYTNRIALYNHAIPKEKGKREYTLRYIYDRYLENTHPVYYGFKCFIIKIRCYLGIRTNIKRLCNMRVCLL